MMSDSAWTVGGTDPSTSALALAGEGGRVSSYPKKLQPEYGNPVSPQDPQDQATNNIISDININDLDIDGIIDDMGFFGSSAEEAGIPSLNSDEEEQDSSGYNGGLTTPSSGSSSSSSSSLNLNLGVDTGGGLLTTASGSSSLNLEGDVGEGGLTTASRSSSSLSLNLGLDNCFAVSVSNEGSNISGSTVSGSDVSSETTEQQQDYCFPSNLDSGLPSIMEQTQEDLQEEEQQQQVNQQSHVVSRQQYSTQQIISSALNAAASPAPMQVQQQQQQQQIQYVPQQQVQQQVQQVQQVVQPTPFAGGEIARRLLSLQPSQHTPNPLLGHHQQYQQQQLQQHRQNQQHQVQQQQVIPNPLLHPVMVYQQQVPQQVQQQQQQQQGQQQQPPQTLQTGLAAAPNLITPSSSLSSSMSLSRTKRMSSSMSSSSHNNNINSNNHNAAYQLTPSASVPVALLSCNNYNNTSNNNNNGTHNAVFNLTPSVSVPSSLLSINKSNSNSNNSNGNHNAVFTNVLEQQRETIARNQQIIDAQNNKLGQVAAKYSTIQDAAVAIIKNKKNVDSAATVKKEEETNSYLKWKCTTAGASKLKALEGISDDTLITSSSVKSTMTHLNSMKKNRKKTNVVISSKGRQPQQLQVYPSQQQSLFGINGAMGNSSGLTVHNHGRHIMKPELLEARRERNRKHAKKSRQRKKSLTTDLEQSLEDLKEENLKLRKCIEESFERKKKLATTTPDNVDSNANVTVAATDTTTECTVDELLESRRVRSHERFIQCIMDDTNYQNNNDTDDDDNDDTTNNNDDKDSGTLLPPSTLSTSSTLPSKPLSTMGTDTGLLASIMNNSLSSSSPSTRSGKGVILNDKTLKILKALSKTIICVPTISSSCQRQQEQEPQSPPACKRQKMMMTTTETSTST